jgi:hypothetical protein
MVSTVDMTWDKSLEDEQKFATTRLRNKSIEEKQMIRQHYTELVDKQMETERVLDKSSFRVLPVQKESLRYDQYARSTGRNEQFFSQRLSTNNNNMRNSTYLQNTPH